MITLARRKADAPPIQPAVPPRDRRPSAPRPAEAAAPARGEATLESRALVALTAVAFCFGLVEMYSASSFIARGEGLPGHYYALKQLTLALGGVVIAAILSRMDYRRYRLWAWPMLAGVSLLLVLVILPGTQAIAPRINGARRWIDLGFTFQPSELAKIAMVIWTAMLAVKKEDKLHSMSKGLVPFLIVWVPVALLIFLEPNMSAALLVILLSALVLFAGGAEMGHLILVGVMAFAVLRGEV